MSFRPRYISALCTNEAIASPPPRTLLLQPARLRARTEQASPEADHRRAGRDGLLEIARHAHRELGETQLVAQPSDPIERRPCQARLARRCDRHQPVDAAPDLLQACDHAGHLFRRAAAPALETDRK